MKLKYVLILPIFFFASHIVAQQMDIVWQECLGTDSDETPGCIASTVNGTIVSLGVGKSTPYISNFHGGGDPWVVRLDSLGNIIWESCYGGSGGEGFYKIIEAPSKGFYLIGGTNSDDGDVQSNNYHSYTNWVVRIDSIGNILWEQCYGGYGFDDFQDAAPTPDGGLIVGTMVTTDGGDISTFYGERDVWLFRIDVDGKMLWEKSYGNHSMNRINKMITTSNGTYMFTGSFYEKGGMIDCQKDELETETDVWVVEIDINGEIVFQNCFGGSHSETGTGLVETEDGLVFLAHTNSNDQDVSGYHGVAGEVSNDIWVFSIDTTGNLQWQNCLGGSNPEAAASVFNSGDKSYIVIGFTNSFDGDVIGNHSINGSSDIWVVNIDSVGEITWQQCIGSGDRESLLQLNTATQINDYNYVIACETGTLHGDVECEINHDPYDSSTDAWVINIKDCSQFQPSAPQQPIGTDTLCVNTDSITTYSTTHSANAWYYEWQLLPEEAGTVTQDSLTNKIHWNPTYEGTATLKVRSYNDCGESEWSDNLDIFTYICLGTDENDIGVPGFVVYPNPVHDLLNIKCRLKTGSELGIAVYDVFGRLVYNSESVNSKNPISINTTNWQSGLYFVMVINSGNNLGIRKVVVE
jgi:type IX secretion system substrate protein/PKD domain-containing protein